MKGMYWSLWNNTPQSIFNNFHMKLNLYYFLSIVCCLAYIACGSDLPDNEVGTEEKKSIVISNPDVDTEDRSSSNKVPGVRPDKSGPDDEKVQRVGFYNVENFFDTEDDPRRKDDEFTENGSNQWEAERYSKKLRHITKVIDYMGQPGIMGLCEVENQEVLKDLIKAPLLKDAKYAFVHQDSPDMRGIDAALLYSKDEYKLVKKDFIRINFPRSVVEDYTTRDIVYATLQNDDKEYFHVFVNHWPSRRGGVEASEPKRTYVAQQVRKKIDEIFSQYDNNHVILVGDFNDEPANKSVNQVLNAKPEVSDPKPEQLYDLMYDLEREGYGSYNYRGDWNMLDHIIVSGSLLDDKGTEAKNPKIFNRNWMLFYHKKSNQYRPNRTFSGPRYHGGYSDHLPVSVEIRTK